MGGPGMQLICLKDMTGKEKILLLKQLGYCSDGRFVLDLQGHRIKDGYADVEIKLSNMLVLPGGVILDDNPLSVAAYIEEHGPGAESVAGAAKTVGKAPKGCGEDWVGAMAKAALQGRVAFIQDKGTWDVVLSQRKNQEWTLYQKYLCNRDMRLLVAMGFCLRQLGDKPQKLKTLTDRLLSRYGPKGLNLAQLAQHGGFRRYIPILLEDKDCGAVHDSACTRCGMCCMIYGVCVTLTDILRIARATGMKPSEFLMLIPENPEMELKKGVVTIGRKRCMLVLKWHNGRVCPFYTGSGCRIYDARPAVCRMYPFRLNGGRLADREFRVCPSHWMPKNKGPYLAEQKRGDKELEAYYRLAAEWNRAPGADLDSFISFLMEKARLQARQL